MYLTQNPLKLRRFASILMHAYSHVVCIALNIVAFVVLRFLCVITSISEIPAIIKPTVVKCNLQCIIMKIMWFSGSLTGKFIKTPVDYRRFPFHRDNLSEVYAIFEYCDQQNQADFFLISLEKFEAFRSFWNLINFVVSRIWIYLKRNSLWDQHFVLKKNRTNKYSKTR